jgi:hypothetical protein
MYMIVYSVSQFKQNTRKILDEALLRPVYIQRYDCTFLLQPMKVTPTITPKEPSKKVGNTVGYHKPERHPSLRIDASKGMSVATAMPEELTIEPLED